MNEYQDYAAFAEELAELARPIAMRYFRQSAAYDYKDDASPVTIADKEIEAAIRAEIKQSYPDHGIMGEEFGTEAGENEFVWVIDPIDGTRAFMAGKPTFTTLIALCHHGEPVIGVIEQPYLKERWLGVKGQPTRLNGSAVTVSRCQVLNQAMLSTTSPDYFGAQGSAFYHRVKDQARDVVLGCDAYAYALLATGGIDLVIESGLKPYDFCAIAPVVTGAGGVMSDWDGRPLTFTSTGDVIAAAGQSLQEQLLEYRSV